MQIPHPALRATFSRWGKDARKDRCNCGRLPARIATRVMKDRRYKSYLLSAAASSVSTLLAAWIGLAQQSPQPDANALKDAAQSKEWLTYGGNYAETRYSPLRQIDASNVARLGLAWTYAVGRGGGNQEATPLFHNGVLYGITNWSIAFAVDAKTGQELWRFDPNVDRAFAA